MVDREEIRAAIARAAARHPIVAAAWLFGSLARGDASAASDLDVAILPRHPPDPAERVALFDLVAELERLSPSGAVDLLVLGDQGSVLRHRILEEGLLAFDADPEARIAFEGRTFVDYLDWKPTHDIAMRSSLAGLRDRFARLAR